MKPPPPLPRWIPAGLIASAALCLGAAAGLAATMPTLRQGRLVEEARAVCASRLQAARLELATSDAVQARLADERASAELDAAHWLVPGDEAALSSELGDLARRNQLDVGAVELGTPRAAGSLDALPVRIELRGDPVDLPPFLAALYAHPLALRLVGLDVETPRYGSDAVQIELRWEYAARPEPRQGDAEVAVRLSPPALVWADPGQVHAVNRGRFRRLQADALELRTLRPALTQLAREQELLQRLRDQAVARKRWQEAERSEALAVARQLPTLLRQAEVNALGRAALRPGPGGALRISES